MDGREHNEAEMTLIPVSGRGGSVDPVVKEVGVDIKGMFTSIESESF
jgi:hypothetical protein